MSLNILRHRRLCTGIALLAALAGGLWLWSPGQADEGPAPTAATPRQTPSPPAPNTSDRFPHAELPDHTFARLKLDDLRGKQATVLVFMSLECPISNGYIPELNRIHEEYADRGLTVIGLNPNAGQSLVDMVAHRNEYEVAFPTLKDAGAQLANQLEVKTCPQVLLFDAAGKIQYRGRVDDRFIRRGGAAYKVHRHDLEVAIGELLAGKPISQPELEAIGCPVYQPRVADEDAAKTATVTFHKDVAPVLAKNCQSCHRPGGIGPFSLQTYDDAVIWAEDIVHFSKQRLMPPWKAEPGYGEFVGARSMSDADIQILSQWLAQGCAEGQAPEKPLLAEVNTGWELGEPDLILEPATEIVIDADGEDLYQCFTLPTNFEKDQYVVAMEVLPGNARVVHHVIAFIDTSGTARRLDAKSPEPGYATSGGFPGFLPTSGLGGWAPGNTPDRLPDGMAKILPQGADVVMQVHYHKTGREERDKTRLGIHFSKVPVTRPVYNISLAPIGSAGPRLTIPAGDQAYKVSGSMGLPSDFLALRITPHMHLLGTDMKVTATLPDGTVKPLVWVKNWDFNWQESYQFAQPVELPQGTILEMEAHFNNSTSNPYNPHRPPQVVNWGPETTDEMCLAFIDVAPKAEVDDPTKLRNPTVMERLEFFRKSRELAGQKVEFGVLPILKLLQNRGQK